MRLTPLWVEVFAIALLVVVVVVAGLVFLPRSPRQPRDQPRHRRK